jgi:hypothetical protein
MWSRSTNPAARSLDDSTVGHADSWAVFPPQQQLLEPAASLAPPLVEGSAAGR